MNAIKTKGLTKKYEKFTLGPIDVEIPCGQIVGLIGENGAGKTTFIKSILGIVNKTSGVSSIFDSENIDKIKEDIGIVLDNTFLPEALRVCDVDFVMKDIFKNWDRDLFNKYLKDFNIDAKVKIKTLSTGMRKKLEIATALSHHPKLLILDEPTSGLDPVVRNEVLDIFLDFINDGDHTIMLSTHITSDLEQIADRIIFIDKGNIILDKARKDLMENLCVIKCDEDKFNAIDKTDIMAYKKNRFDYEVLLDDHAKVSSKYPDYAISQVTLEELMVILIKGVR